ncbi:MAG: NUDIX domain-containing protein [Acidimicrobiales bacterium]|nr:NUDIX domain-containing protein [Acidimicrobiales bacterium]
MAQPDQTASTGHASPGSGGDYDPESIAIRSAATVLILADRPDLQVLMLKRNARSIFVGDMWVFPGGAVDPEDGTPEADAVVEGLTDTQASKSLGIDKGGVAFWVAALRETFEEAGILLARTPGDDRLVDLSPSDTEERFATYRAGVNAGEVDFVSMVREQGLVLDGSGVHYVSRWVTPLGAPRRYDTRFFVTAMPEGQQALHDDDEAVHHEWIRPAEALALNESDEMLMMTPTVSMLNRLCRFRDAAEAITAAAGSTEDHNEMVRIRYGIEGPGRIAWPDDRDYGQADPRAESGMVRWPCRRPA